MLLDDLMPRYDVFERHATLVRATPDQVWTALRRTDLGRSIVVKILLALRGLPSLMRRNHEKRLERVDLDAFVRAGFSIVAEDRPREMVIGLEGPFWHPTCRPRPVSREAFGTPRPANTALAGWNFTLARHGEFVHLATETRVLCSDASARWKFRLYWSLIGRFSGVIRHYMLREVKREAERSVE